VTSTLKTSLWLVFPHQLFDQLPSGVETVAIVEEALFFHQYAFHKPKPKAAKTSNISKSNIDKEKGKGKKP
jgi:hypothetical protein